MFQRFVLLQFRCLQVSLEPVWFLPEEDTTGSMLRFGIFTLEQYLQAQRQGRQLGPQVSYRLLEVTDPSSADQVKAFEDISFTLHTSNYTYRTTFRNRFDKLNQLALPWIEKMFPADTPLKIQDRAVSHGLTSAEWAKMLFPRFPQAEMLATDILVELIELQLPDGTSFIFDDPGQAPLQYLAPPRFAVPVYHLESWRFPVNRILGGQAQRNLESLRLPNNWHETEAGDGYRVRRIPYVHPQAKALERDSGRFHYRQGSVFDVTEPCHLLRTMNILIPSYFSADQLSEASRAIHKSLLPGGLWIVGRTLEEDFSHHATFLERQDNGWKTLNRIGNGAEIERLVLETPLA